MGGHDDVWYAAGRDSGDLEVCLRALSLRSGDRPALIAVAGRDAGGARLVLASRALFALFGVADGHALAKRLLGGRDPGALRLATLDGTLPLDGAPRLERLRFAIGPGSEIITFLCRRILAGDGRPLFVAAALGVRAGLLSAPDKVSANRSPSASEPVPDDATVATAPLGDVATLLGRGPLNVQEIQEALRLRWPAQRILRFLWQTDADGVCTSISPPLAEIVGDGNADLVGRSLLDLAPRLDASGKLDEALRSRSTWSGIDVDWPIVGAPAAVAVGLGAIPAFESDRAFAGYRGYGVVRLDEVTTCAPSNLDGGRGSTPAASQAEMGDAGKVIAFPTKDFSSDDERAFAALAAELRAKAGLSDRDPPSAPEAPPAAPSVPEPGDRRATALTVAAASADVSDTEDQRSLDVGRNGMALFDKLAIGILVSRDNIPIFANRHLLELTGFADEDALHEAGGAAHLFGGTPGNASGTEAVGLRTRSGTIVPAKARVQRVEWDGLPASMLTLQGETGGKPVADPTTRIVAPSDDDAEAQAAARPVAEPVRNDDGDVRELRAILETATDGVVVMDGAGTIVSLNRAAEALLGCDRHAVAGKPFLSLFAAHNQNLAADYLEGLRSDAKRSLLNDGREISLKAQQGGTIPVFMTLGRLGPTSDAIAPGDQSARFCALFRDLTHWKKVEGELDDARRAAERASALKTDFLAKVSHEVRTPLNAILGFAEVIMQERFGPLGSERYKDYLRDIHASGTHVMSLVDDLLDLSKIEAGKMELSSSPIEVNRIVGECVALMQPQANRERVIMRLSLARSLPKVEADERSLRQIVLNILSNAVKFNEPGGQVIVATTTTESGHVVLRIRDTGPGMSDAEIAAALEPFRQVSNAPGEADRAGREGSGQNGTGLGLPLTKALVEANAASFTIRSKVDHGTFVEVAFPPERVLAGS